MPALLSQPLALQSHIAAYHIQRPQLLSPLNLQRHHQNRSDSFLLPNPCATYCCCDFIWYTALGHSGARGSSHLAAGQQGQPEPWPSHTSLGTGTGMRMGMGTGTVTGTGSGCQGPARPMVRVQKRLESCHQLEAAAPWGCWSWGWWLQQLSWDCQGWLAGHLPEAGSGGKLLALSGVGHMQEDMENVLQAWWYVLVPRHFLP